MSEHLHEWIDLIFGFKQRGPAAREAQNLFVEVVYGEVDVEAIEDDFERSALISQVENFGLAPFCIFKKPHPRRSVPEIFKLLQKGGSTISAIKCFLGWVEKSKIEASRPWWQLQRLRKPKQQQRQRRKRLQRQLRSGCIFK